MTAINQIKALGWLSDVNGQCTPLQVSSYENKLSNVYLADQDGMVTSDTPGGFFGGKTLGCGTGSLIYSVATAIPYDIPGMVLSQLNVDMGRMDVSHATEFEITNLTSDYADGNGTHTMTSRFKNGKPTYVNENGWVIFWNGTDWTLSDAFVNPTLTLKNGDTDQEGGDWTDDGGTQHGKGPSSQTFEYAISDKAYNFGHAEGQGDWSSTQAAAIEAQLIIDYAAMGIEVEGLASVEDLIADPTIISGLGGQSALVGMNIKVEEPLKLNSPANNTTSYYVYDQVQYRNFYLAEYPLSNSSSHVYTYEGTHPFASAGLCIVSWPGARKCLIKLPTGQQAIPTPTPTPHETMYYDTYPELLGDIVISNHEIDSYNGTYTQVRPTPGVLPGSDDPNAFDGDVESWTPYAGDGHKYPVWVQTNPGDFNKYISFCYSWAGDTKRWVISSSIGGKAFAGPGDNRINTYVGTNPADSDLGTETPPDFGGIPWECTSWTKLTDGTTSSLTMSNPFVTPTPTGTISIDFTVDGDDWTGDASDYSLENTPDDVITTREAIPDYNMDGMRLSGTNESDDLFVYIRKKYEGLLPNAYYAFDYNVNIISDMPTGCAGVGGGGADAVYFRAGTTKFEPTTVTDNNSVWCLAKEPGTEYEGNQANDGKASKVMGTIANTQTDCGGSSVFELKNLTATKTVFSETNENGEVWHHLGTDSGFESYSRVYIKDITINWTLVSSIPTPTPSPTPTPTPPQPPIHQYVEIKNHQYAEGITFDWFSGYAKQHGHVDMNGIYKLFPGWKAIGNVPAAPDYEWHYVKVDYADNPIQGPNQNSPNMKIVWTADLGGEWKLHNTQMQYPQQTRPSNQCQRDMHQIHKGLIARQTANETDLSVRRTDVTSSRWTTYSEILPCYPYEQNAELEIIPSDGKPSLYTKVVSSPQYAIIGPQQDQSVRYNFERAFDGNLTTSAGAWYCRGGLGLRGTGWIGQDFGSNKHAIGKYRILPLRVSGERTTDPKNWVLEASNDNFVNKVVLDRQDNQTFTHDNTFGAHWNEYIISNTTEYQYYRLNITANNSGGDSLVIQEIEMMIISEEPFPTPTPINVPVITVQPTTLITQTSAVVNGLITNSDQTSVSAPIDVKVAFEHFSDPGDNPNAWPDQIHFKSDADGKISQQIDGLEINTLYYFRFFVETPYLPTSFSPPTSFRTLASTPTPTPAPTPTPTPTPTQTWVYSDLCVTSDPTKWSALYSSEWSPDGTYIWDAANQRYANESAQGKRISLGNDTWRYHSQISVFTTTNNSNDLPPWHDSINWNHSKDLGISVSICPTPSPTPSPYRFDHGNFPTAVNMWFSDKSAAIAKYGHISDWDVSTITDMNDAFRDKTTFNDDISRWDVSNVTKMDRMFKGATAFNQDIGNWDTAKVGTTSNGTYKKSGNMEEMFRGATSFNKDINTKEVTVNGNTYTAWDVSHVKWMDSMFNDASAFNQPIGAWNTSSVKGMFHMFMGATAFNQNIGDWNVSKVTDMRNMFEGCVIFNKPIGNWDVSSCTNMSVMFKNAHAFNQNIGNWNVSKVNMMSQMFSASNTNGMAFNQDINTKEVTVNGNTYTAWDVSTVGNMTQMFWASTSFNKDISSWDTSSVSNMRYMFGGASAFDQDISGWDVTNVNDYGSAGFADVQTNVNWTDDEKPCWGLPGCPTPTPTPTPVFDFEISDKTYNLGRTSSNWSLANSEQMEAQIIADYAAEGIEIEGLASVEDLIADPTIISRLGGWAALSGVNIKVEEPLKLEAHNSSAINQDNVTDYYYFDGLDKYRNFYLKTPGSVSEVSYTYEGEHPFVSKNLRIMSWPGGRKCLIKGKP